MKIKIDMKEYGSCPVIIKPTIKEYSSDKNISYEISDINIIFNPNANTGNKTENMVKLCKLVKELLFLDNMEIGYRQDFFNLFRETLRTELEITAEAVA